MHEDQEADLLGDLLDHPAWPIVAARFGAEVTHVRDAFFAAPASGPEFGDRALIMHAVVSSFREVLTGIYLSVGRELPASIKAKLE